MDQWDRRVKFCATQLPCWVLVRQRAEQMLAQNICFSFCFLRNNWACDLLETFTRFRRWLVSTSAENWWWGDGCSSISAVICSGFSRECICAEAVSRLCVTRVVLSTLPLNWPWNTPLCVCVCVSAHTAHHSPAQRWIQCNVYLLHPRWKM